MGMYSYLLQLPLGWATFPLITVHLYRISTIALLLLPLPHLHLLKHYKEIQRWKDQCHDISCKAGFHLFRPNTVQTHKTMYQQQ